jgi:predicted TIM-barrel fold metal-dependent hydrolase
MMYYCHHTVEMQLALMDLIVGGTLERFPRLQFGFIEAHTAWLPGWLAQMDSLGSWLSTNKLGNKGERYLSQLPTEFFRRQCFLASFPDDAWIDEAVRSVGEDNVVIGTDYPHPGTCSKMKETFVKSYPDMSESVRDKLLGGNAMRIFGWSAA